MDYEALKTLLAERGYDLIANMEAKDPGDGVYAAKYDPFRLYPLGSQYNIGLYQFENQISEYLDEILPEG